MPYGYGLFLLNSSPPSAPMNCVSIGSDNGLVPVQHQAILPEPMTYCQLDSQEQTSVKL